MVLLTKGGLIAAGGTGGGGGGFTGVLDAYTANLAGAWDSRRLLSSYAGPILRTVGGLDVGYNSDGSLDTSGLTGTQYEAKRYDQSGNGRDLIWSGATNGGPRIINSGALETLNGHACSKIVVGVQEIAVATRTAYTGTNLAAVWVGRLGSQDVSDRLLSLTPGSTTDWNSADRAALINVSAGGTFPSLQTYRATSTTTVDFTDQATMGISVRFDGTNEIMRNPASTGTTISTVASTGSWGFTTISVGYLADSLSNLNANSYVGTIVMWDGDPGSTNVEAVRSEAATYWGGS